MSNSMLEGTTIVLTHSCDIGVREDFCDVHPGWWHPRDRDTGQQAINCVINDEFDRMLCLSLEQVLDKMPGLTRCGDAQVDESHPNGYTQLRCTVIGRLGLDDFWEDRSRHWSEQVQSRVGLKCDSMKLEDSFELPAADVLGLLEKDAA